MSLYSKIKKEHLFIFIVILVALIFFNYFNFGYTGLAVKNTCYSEGYSCCAAGTGQGDYYFSLDDTCNADEQCWDYCKVENLITTRVTLVDAVKELFDKVKSFFIKPVGVPICNCNNDVDCPAGYFCDYSKSCNADGFEALCAEVLSPISVSVLPSSATLYTGQSQQFTATVTGTTNTYVSWGVSSSTCGSITSYGLYTAPTFLPSMTCSVTATSAANPTMSDSAMVTINPSVSGPCSGIPDCSSYSNSRSSCESKSYCEWRGIGETDGPCTTYVICSQTQSEQQCKNWGCNWRGPIDTSAPTVTINSPREQDILISPIKVEVITDKKSQCKYGFNSDYLGDNFDTTDDLKHEKQISTGNTGYSTLNIQCTNKNPGGQSSDIKSITFIISPYKTECGNNKVEYGEECDDGNLVSGDGCSSTCQLETPILTAPTITDLKIEANGIKLTWTINAVETEYTSFAILDTNLLTGSTVKDDLGNIFDKITDFFKKLLGIKVRGIELSKIKEFKLYKGTSLENLVPYTISKEQANCINGICSYLDTNVESGKTYYYKIAVVDINNVESRLSGQKNILYTIAPSTYNLKITLLGTGYGAVVEQNRLINGKPETFCGEYSDKIYTDCQRNYPAGDLSPSINLDSVPRSDSIFEGWSGDCASFGKSRICYFNSINKNIEVKATFNCKQATCGDTTAPTIKSVSPVSNAQNIPLNTNVIVTFSEPMDTAATGTAFSLKDQQNNNIVGVKTWTNNDNTLTFDPSSDLQNNKQYTIKITTAAKDKAGISLAQEYNSIFTTTSGADTQAPIISLISVGGDTSLPYETTDSTPDIVFNTDENAYCRISLTDQGYDEMTASKDCGVGQGTTSHTCTAQNVGNPGIKNVYLSCADAFSPQNKHTSDNNKDISLTLKAQLTSTIITFPENGKTYNRQQLVNIRGTASHATGISNIAKVEIYIKDNVLQNTYYDGQLPVNVEKWVTATKDPQVTDKYSWYYTNLPYSSFNANGNRGYTICSRAVSTATTNNIQDPPTCIIFTYSTTPQTTICTPGSLKSGTQCLICNAQGTAYSANNDVCKTAYGSTSICNAQGQCVIQPAQKEICDNDKDDDGDGIIDGLDRDCAVGAKVTLNKVDVSDDEPFEESEINLECTYSATGPTATTGRAASCITGKISNTACKFEDRANNIITYTCDTGAEEEDVEVGCYISQNCNTDTRDNKNTILINVVKPDLCEEVIGEEVLEIVSQKINDDEFKIGEEIKADLKIKNDDVDDKDIVAEALLYDLKEKELIKDATQTKEIKARRSENFKLKITVPSVEESLFKIYYKIYEKNNEDEFCIESSEKLKIKGVTREDCDKDNDNENAVSCGGQDCNDNDATINPDAIEICTDNKDNDCNGLIDARDPSCATGACISGETRECGIETGECKRGVQTCINRAWGGCVGAIMPTTEICADNLDNDCDGNTDASDSDCAVGDSDNDGLDDSFELQYFGNLAENADDDFDGDGFTNLEEFLAGTDPTNPEDKPKKSKILVPILIVLGILVIAFILVWLFALRPKKLKPTEIKFKPAQTKEIKQQVNPALLQYIKSSLKKGFTKQQIKNALLLKGWTEREIEEAFKYK